MAKQANWLKESQQYLDTIVRKDVSFIRLEQTKMALLARLRGKFSSEDYAILHQIITCMDEQLTIACGYLYNKSR